MTRGVAQRRAIIWFRRDLRLADHAALTAAGALTAAATAPTVAVAASGGRGRDVVGVFVLDPALLRTDSKRAQFLLGSLAALNEEMGGCLWVLSGKPVEVIPKLARRLEIEDVYVSQDYAPFGRRRDDAVAKALESVGSRLVAVGSSYAVAPGTVLNGSGTPYRVFTPFSKAWERHGWGSPLPQPDISWIPPERQPQTPYAPSDLPAWAVPGERAALDALDHFVERDLDGYGTSRNTPGLDSTSRLSPHLRFGTIHPRTVLARLGDSRSHQVFRNEMAWREFYADVLYHQPTSAWETMQPKMRGMRCDTDKAAQQRFAAWCRGETGFPLVDAGMRQLAAEGFMHNRVRMVVASFLIKDLHLPWQWGAKHFQEQLIDFDLASNSHGWQWVAGTGTDAAPYYRIFNPEGQRERFDSDSAYIDRWAAGGYGLPIVDHAEERVEALARLAEL